MRKLKERIAILVLIFIPWLYLVFAAIVCKSKGLGWTNESFIEVFKTPDIHVMVAICTIVTIIIFKRKDKK